MRTFFLVACAVAAAGCLSSNDNIVDGTLKCGPDPNRPCPQGFVCAGDGKCWRNGSMAPVAKGRGQTCVLDGDCATHHCVDGFCCDSACTGQCQACDFTGGICTTITGAPHHNRPPCPSVGFDSCNGVCDGHDPNACSWPGPSTICQPQRCSGSPPSLESEAVCDGAGHCLHMTDMIFSYCPPAPTGGTASCTGNQCDFFCNFPYVRVGSTCVIPDMP